MKTAIIIPDGAADRPIKELNGRTCLQAASTPNMDWIASHGKIGTVRNVPKGLPCGSDVAIMSVLGYDPKEHYSGRAPLEATAQNLHIDPDQWVFRCNLVTIVDGEMVDHSAGHISNQEAEAILAELADKLAGPDVAFFPGVSYRHLMTFRGELRIRTTPPHDILGKRAAGYMPSGRGSEAITALIERSQQILADHEINAVRRDLGENPASSIWLWGEGKMPQLPPFQELYGKRGAVITAVDLVRGLARLIGWDIIEVEGATGYVNTNYAGKGAAACRALDEYDIVVVHVEAPDEAGHNADVAGKVESIAQIDQHIVGPLLKRLQGESGEWRILVVPDHPTPIEVRTHTFDPSPFAIAGSGIEGVVHEPFSEESAEASDMHVPRGHELMEFLLTVR